MVVTRQNRQDFENAKRFFEGFSFTDIKTSIETGCFKKADIIRIENDSLDMNFQSLALTFYNKESAVIGNVAEVYDENGNILGSYDFSKKEVTIDTVRDFLKESENFKNVLIYIKNNFPEEWTDFVSTDVLDKNKVIDYINNNQHEVKEILEGIERYLIASDIPSTMQEKAVKEWFYRAYYSDIISKVQDCCDFRDFVKHCIDEL